MPSHQCADFKLALHFGLILFALLAAFRFFFGTLLGGVESAMLRLVRCCNDSLRLVNGLAHIRELASACCPWEEARLCSQTGRQTDWMVLSSRCFSDMVKARSSARFFDSPARVRISSLHWQVDANHLASVNILFEV